MNEVFDTTYYNSIETQIPTDFHFKNILLTVQISWSSRLPAVNNSQLLMGNLPVISAISYKSLGHCGFTARVAYCFTAHVRERTTMYSSAITWMEYCFINVRWLCAVISDITDPMYYYVRGCTGRFLINYCAYHVAIHAEACMFLIANEKNFMLDKKNTTPRIACVKEATISKPSSRNTLNPS